MEAGTTPARGTGSTTIADLLRRGGGAVRRPTSRISTRSTASGATSRSPRSARSSTEIGLGLIDLGHPAGRPGRHPRQHAPGVDLRGLRDLLGRRGRRPDLPDELAGGVRVGRRQLGVGRVVCEDAEQVAKIVEVRDSLPRLRDDRRDRPGAARRRRDLPRRAARARPRPRPAPSSRRARRPSGPTTRSPSSTRRARPARRRAACSPTATTARSSTWSRSASCSASGDDLVYLFLPLAHAFALLIQLGDVRPRHARSPTSAATRSRSSPSSWRSSRPTCRRCRASSRSSTRWPSSS